MSDEARHVAFGVLSLKEYYGELTDAELRERQEFAFEAAVRMRDRFLQQEVWDRMGIDSRLVIRSMLAVPPEENVFQQMLFSKIVPNCRKLGLLDASGGWLRRRFEELGVIQFEHWTDTGEEYADLDEVARDRCDVLARGRRTSEMEPSPLAVPDADSPTCGTACAAPAGPRPRPWTTGRRASRWPTCRSCATTGPGPTTGAFHRAAAERTRPVPHRDRRARHPRAARGSSPEPGRCRWCSPTAGRARSWSSSA